MLLSPVSQCPHLLKPSSFCARRLAIAALLGSCFAARHLSGQRPAQEQSVKREAIGTGLTVFRSSRGNLLLRAGGEEAILIGSPLPELARAAQAQMNRVVLRWAVVFLGDSASSYGDAGWARAGANVVVHESLRGLLWSTPVDSTSRISKRPSIGFSEAMQLSLRGDELHLVHQPRAYSAADIIAHLESADVMLLGPLYHSDSYPAISIEFGGRIDGLIDVISTFVRTFAGRHTIFVPGVGPSTGIERLTAYRDMLIRVRSRVAQVIADGGSEKDAVALQITREFDPQWGRDGRGDEFVRVVFRSLAKDASRRAP